MSMMKTWTIGSTALAAAMLSVTTGAQAKDIAVVAGVDNYSKLSNANLKGCVNDAEDMAKELKPYGFEVRFLANPTKKQILDAITEAAAQKPGRFVFYFAGHGTTLSKGDGAILPSDTNASDEYSLISSPELYEAVKKVPSNSRSIILDSCYSGAMVRSKDLFANKGTARYYDFGSARYSKEGTNDNKNLSIPAASRAASPKDIRKRPDETVAAQPGQPLKEVGLAVVPETIEAAPQVCYFVAADKDQVALETNQNGRVHGYFTYYLTNYLGGKPVMWGQAGTYVTSRLQTIMQRPMLTDHYADQTMFSQTVDSPVEEPKHKATDLTGWAIFNTSRSDASKLQLKLISTKPGVNPDKPVFEVNDGLKLEAIASRPGYLLLLEKGTSGRHNVLYPESMKIDDARVSANSRIPEEGFEFAPDAPGFEEIRAFWFAESEKIILERILEAFKSSADNEAKTSVPPANLGKLEKAMAEIPTGRDLFKVSTAKLFTANLTFTVADPKRATATNFTTGPSSQSLVIQPVRDNTGEGR